MSIETITEYIDPQLFIVVPMLWGIGMAVKRSKIENRFIPLILLLCSCSVVLFYPPCPLLKIFHNPAMPAAISHCPVLLPQKRRPLFDPHQK